MSVFIFVVKSREIAFYIIGISDDKWLQMKISNFYFMTYPEEHWLPFPFTFIISWNAWPK